MPRSARPSRRASSSAPCWPSPRSPVSSRSSWSAPTRLVLRRAAALGATPVRQSDEGLNEGLRAAVRWAVADGAGAILVLAADLPGVTGGAIEAVVTAATGSAAAGPLMVIVADRHGRGTNALLVSPPDALPFAFGPDSRAAHLASARAAGALIVELDGPLSFDLDLPEDLLRAEELGLLDPARGG